MTVENDVSLALSLKLARRQVKGCITSLEQVRRHTELKASINSMLARLRTSLAELTEALCEVRARLRARLPAAKEVADA